MADMIHVYVMMAIGQICRDLIPIELKVRTLLEHGGRCRNKTDGCEMARRCQRAILTTQDQYYYVLCAVFAATCCHMQ